MLSSILQTNLNTINHNLSLTQQQQLQAYVALLLKWNRVYNLTAIHDEQAIWIKHIFDSLAVLPYVRGVRILDVGTGAGLPGLLWAIAQPDWHYTLLDSNGKKIRFIQQCVGELGLNQIEVVHSRIEIYQPSQQFDTITSRAYSELQLFYQQTTAFCYPTGCWLAMKGTYPEQELDALATAPLKIHVEPLQVPLLDAQRHVVVMSPQG